jgi:UDP-N-acetylmuramoyl-L-alanine---L-glutamate ligase
MITWDDLRGKTVAVWGLGREGQANVRKLREIGVDPVLVDDQPADASVHPTGSGVLTEADVVVKTPGISRYRPEVAELTSRGIPVVGGLGLWLADAGAVDRAKVVAVTGTKGKSTTTSIIAHLLNGLGYRCAAGGNIGTVPYDPANATDVGPEYWVIEVSSYQATDLECSPPVVAVTSLHPDHLDWHGSVQRYYRDKLSVCTRPGADLTVANGDSDLLRARRDLLGPRVDWVTAVAQDAQHGQDGEDARWAEPLALPGEHNRRNALIARHCLAALGIPAAAQDDALRKAAAGYRNLPSRLATIGIIDGVRFVDDSLSTNVLPVLAALDAFPGERIALIAGGHDRGIDYAPLAEGLARRPAPTVVFTLPDSGPRIGAAVRAAGGEARDCADLGTAVDQGFGWARPAGVVLLSPAAPSFGQFRDYAERADAFARAMRALSPTP